ncbi:hypothetical protein JTE90_026442 [Oedothorax gibbosus]|uniref:Uncharacterized protein n=1 Tax=Oedothorax gibbosus TaxID=931172 RepID=A0AAV6VRY4_9ARAC|nr:hypothetical protein JTE90_026442 [Oedothorax gibbosus]
MDAISLNPHDRATSALLVTIDSVKMATRKKILTQDEILQILNENNSELSGFSDDDGDDQTFEPRMLEGQSSSDDEENDQSIILDRPSTSRSPDPSPQSSIPTQDSTKVKMNKKEKKTYKCVVKKYTPVPHPGPLDFTQLPSRGCFEGKQIRVTKVISTVKERRIDIDLEDKELPWTVKGSVRQITKSMACLDSFTHWFNRPLKAYAAQLRK